jgi:ABC-type glycerol-3-phosphate transport system substrate-binding protein
MNYSMGLAEFGAFTLSNLMVLHRMFSRDDSSLALLPGLADDIWKPSTIAGISVDSKLPELSAEFVNLMLSVDVQRLNYGTGLPVTKEGMASQEAAITEIAQDIQSSMTINIDDLISKLHTPSMYDDQLKDMIWENVERYLKGELSLDEALSAAEQAVKNYLAEREV